MKKRITFLIIPSKSGQQRRISVNKNILYCILFLTLALLGSGIVGAWKYRENVTLRKQCQLLEAEKAQLEAVNRTVKDIKRDEVAIRKLLGLDSVNNEEKP